MLRRSLRARAERGQRGAVGVNLAVTLGFALYAVVQLTRTTLAAEQIDSRVKVITSNVNPINTNLNQVPKLDETNRIAASINTEASKLSQEAGIIIDTAKSIDTTVTGINANAQSINGTVHAISGNVVAIQSTVHGIGGNIAGINGVVGPIRQGIIDINHRADVVIALANPIHSDLHNTLLQVGGPAAGGLSFAGGGLNIDGHASSIDCTLLGATCQR